MVFEVFHTPCHPRLRRLFALTGSRAARVLSSMLAQKASSSLTRQPRVHPRTILQVKARRCPLKGDESLRVNWCWRGSLNRSLAGRRVVPGRHNWFGRVPCQRLVPVSHFGVLDSPPHPLVGTPITRTRPKTLAGTGGLARAGFFQVFRNLPTPADPPEEKTKLFFDRDVFRCTLKYEFGSPGNAERNRRKYKSPGQRQLPSPGEALDARTAIDGTADMPMIPYRALRVFLERRESGVHFLCLARGDNKNPRTI